MINKIRNKIPNPEHIHKLKGLSVFGDLLKNPNLWKRERHTISKGVAIGLFVAFIPIPFQMVLAAAIAIITQGNLPISVSLVWITNPLTIPFLFYITYTIGEKITGNSDSITPEMLHSLNSILEYGPEISWVFMIGCLATSILLSTIGFVSVHAAYLFKKKKIDTV